MKNRLLYFNEFRNFGNDSQRFATSVKFLRLGARGTLTFRTRERYTVYAETKINIRKTVRITLSIAIFDSHSVDDRHVTVQASKQSRFLEKINH